MKQKALFIINPVSGGRKKDQLPGLISQNLDLTKFEPVIKFSNGIGHATRLAIDAKGIFDIVVAVGGDGTVNEVAAGIAQSSVVMGIIPCGSGNGLARFLQIPMDLTAAIKTINNFKVDTIDAGKLNGQWFFNMAGMGFDAHIADLFSNNKTRGFITYAKSALRELMRYKPQYYQISIDGRRHQGDAFMLSFANSSQYGNNAFISPGASATDGLLDVCFVRPIPFYRFPDIIFAMFSKQVHKSKYVEIIRGKHIRVKCSEPGPVHLDGEPHTLYTDAEIEAVPNALKIITGQRY